MISSKGALVVGGRGFRAVRSDVDPRSLSGFFSAIPPFPAALLGSCAEAEPSGATSATRYDGSECVGIVPMVVPELKLVDVQRQICGAHLMEVADDAAFNQRPKTLDALSVNRTDDILPLSVVDNLMRVVFVQPAIADPLVRDQQADLIRHSLPHEGFEGFAVNAIDNTSRNLTLAADRTNDRRLSRTDATSPATLSALANVAVLSEAADKGFVNLYLAEQLALGAVLHRDPKAMAHIPSCLVRASTEHAVDLKGAHPFLGVVHQERDLEPLDKRVFGVLEDRSGDDREPIAVLIAALAEPVEWAGLNLPHLHVAAARAMDALRPAALSDERLAVFLGLKPGDKLGEGHARFHSADYMALSEMVSSAG
jgi:hypothetical protein